MATKIDLESIDPAACQRLRALIVSERDDAGNMIKAAPFSEHLPEARLKTWISDEINPAEIATLLLKLAQSLVEKYQAEEADAVSRAPAPAA